jgi:hypothetical protein
MFSDHQPSSTQQSRAAAHRPSPSHGRKYRAIIKRQLLLNYPGTKKTYPLLSQLTGTLILAVSEQFNDTTLIWCKTVQMEPLEICSDDIEMGNDRTYPETSLTISRTNAVLLLKWPLVLETRGLTTLASVFYSSKRYVSPSSLGNEGCRPRLSSLQLCPSSSRVGMKILQEVRRARVLD